MEKFDQIELFDDDNDIYARGGDGRLLFRYNKIDEWFSALHPTNITDDEIEFVLLMYDRLAPKFPKDKSELVDLYTKESELICS